MDILQPQAFFDLSAFAHKDLFAGCRYAWQGLERLPAYLQERLIGNVDAVGQFRQPLPQTVILWRGRLWREGFTFLGGETTKGTFRVGIQGEETTEATVLYAGCILWDERIQLGAGTVVEPGALIKGPTLIGSHTEVRQGAYMRGKCLVGDRCVVGHTTEMKASVMLDEAKAGHFAYIGDSILGRSTNLGAGTKLANLKITEGSVRIAVKGERVDTGMRKLGAILGDHVEIGCNAVTNPGTLLGRSCMVLPVSSVQAGYYEPKSILRPRR